MIVRCASCKATHSIASVDQYQGTCRGDVVGAADLQFMPAGYTEIHWDSCEQIGWSCRNCFAEVLVSTDDPLDNLDAALKRLVEVIP